MAQQTFTASQVLTAAQMNTLQGNDYNWTVSTKTTSYVLVAADKGTRVVMNSASATTITVNTSLFSAGDTLFIQNIGAGTCTITAGTATVTTAGSLALGTWDGGTLYFTSASAAIFFSGGGARYGTATGGTSSSITVSSVNYTLLAFTSDNTLTISKSGLFDVMLIGGGAGGGGGGNQAVGGNASASTGGTGGTGYDISTFISGSAALRAVGGAGMPATGTVANGAANTGNGGTGGISSASGGSGGSGIVYVRFKV